MSGGTERAEAAILRRLLRGTRFGRVRWIAETGSTNDDLLRDAAAGGPEQVLIADVQTTGRGRRDRTWHAPPESSVLMSVLVRGWAPSDGFWAVGAVALAAVDAAASVAAVSCTLKWPNDVLVGEAKVAGVLAQLVDDAVVVGIGINVNWPESMAEMVGADAGAGSLQPTSLNDHRPDREPIDRCQLVAAVLTGAEEWLRSPRADLRRGWTAACATIGRDVRLELADGAVVGRAIDVTETGALMLESEGRRSIHEAGDVIHLRTPA